MTARKKYISHNLLEDSVALLQQNINKQTTNFTLPVKIKPLESIVSMYVHTFVTWIFIIHVVLCIDNTLY